MTDEILPTAETPIETTETSVDTSSETLSPMEAIASIERKFDALKTQNEALLKTIEELQNASGKTQSDAAESTQQSASDVSEAVKSDTETGTVKESFTTETEIDKDSPKDSPKDSVKDSAIDTEKINAEVTARTSLLSKYRDLIQDKNLAINYEMTSKGIKTALLKSQFPDSVIDSLSDESLNGFWIAFELKNDSVYDSNQTQKKSNKASSDSDDIVADFIERMTKVRN